MTDDDDLVNVWFDGEALARSIQDGLASMQAGLGGPRNRAERRALARQQRGKGQRRRSR